jgi:transposase InsO family protein
MDSLCHDIILGLDFFSQHDISLRCKTRSLTFSDGTSSQVLTEPRELGSAIRTSSISNSNETTYKKSQIKANVYRRKRPKVRDRRSINFYSCNNSSKVISTNPPGQVTAVLSSIKVIKEIAKEVKQEIYSSWVPIANDTDATLASVHPVTTEVEIEIPKFLEAYKEVFDLSQLERLPNYREEFAMPIDLKDDSRLPTAVPYKLSLKEEQALKTAIQEGLDSGKLEFSSAAGGCPVLFVKKPDGSLRMCIDYRKLNAITESIQAILPNIDDLIASIPVSPSPLFTKMDMKAAFGQLRIRQGDEPKTAFVTKFGKFQSKVIQFGVKNAPGWFQVVMNKLFGHLFGRGVAVYIDDILIFEPDPKKHRVLIFEVLEILKNNRLILNLNKCVFEVDSVDFLGYDLSAKGIKMQENKISAVQGFPAPKCVKDLQRFLGLANYYKEFVKDYSRIAAPLFTLLRKENKFVWNLEADRAFRGIKAQFTKEAVLVFPDRIKPFILYTDCSKVALGAVLAQLDDNNKERTISFYSRSLTPAEKNYPIYDKEMLAIKASFSHWRHLLIQTENPVKVYCDHKNLTYFKNPQLLNERQSRWHEFLADFNYEIYYLPGKENVVADALSRPSEEESNGGREKSVTLLPKSNFKSDFKSLNVTWAEPLENKSVFDYEYYTPQSIVDLAKKVAQVKKFDLDPASCHAANVKTQIAKRYFTKKNDGLKREWFGHVFINPPYKTKQGKSNIWIKKAFDEFQSGRVESVTLLLRDATGSEYFSFVQQHFSLCYLKDRVRFWNTKNNCNTFARDKHVLAYLGPKMADFDAIMKSFGFVSAPMSAVLDSSPIVTATPDIPFNELEEQIQESSSDDLCALAFLKDVFPSESPELQAQIYPHTTNMETWPVFLFYVLKNVALPASIPERFKNLIRMNKKYCIIKNNRLFRKVKYLDHEYEVPYVAVVSRKEKIKAIHETLGHLAHDAVMDSLRTRWWWPQQLKDLKEYQESCAVCQMHRRNSNSSPPNPRVAIPPVGVPFYRWGVDFIQDLPETDQGNRNILVAIDHATRFVITKAVPDRTSKTVALFIFNLMQKFGAPQEIITDRADCFQSVLADYLHLQNIHHLPSTPYHPNTNGTTERVNGVLGNLITKMSLGAPSKWDRFVPSATFIVNARKHSVTGYSPFFLVYGIHPRLPNDVFPVEVFGQLPEDISLRTSHELIRLGQHRYEALKRSQAQAAEYVAAQDPASPVITFEIGQYVKLKNFTKKKFEYIWKGPFIVNSIGPHNTYFLMKPNGELMKNPYNGVHLAPYTVERGNLSEPDPNVPVPSPRSDSLQYNPGFPSQNLI